MKIMYFMGVIIGSALGYCIAGQIAKTTGTHPPNMASLCAVRNLSGYFRFQEITPIRQTPRVVQTARGFI